MSNRASNVGLLDANSQLPITATYSPIINTTNAPISIATGQGVFRGILVVNNGTGGWGANVYDALTTGTLNSTTQIGAVLTTTTGGAIGFQWSGDVIYTTGLTIQLLTGTIAGAVKVLYL